MREERASAALLALLILPLCVALLLAVHHYQVYRLSRQVIEGSVVSVCHEILADYHRPLMEEFGLMALSEQSLIEGMLQEKLQERIEGRIPGDPLRVVGGRLSLKERLNRETVVSRQVLSLGRLAQWSYLARSLADFFEEHRIPKTESVAEEGPETGPLDQWQAGMLNPSEEGSLSLWALFWPGAPVPWLEAQVPRRPPEDQDDLSSWDSSLSQLQDEEIVSGLWAQMRRQWQRILEKGQERIGWSSYLLQQCDYATSVPWKNRFLNKAEVEYILQGRQRSWDNVRETYLELFLLRILIHGANQGRLTPPEGVSWLRVLGQALVLAKDDVEQLLLGRQIQVIPGKGPQAGYRDHLLLLLLLQDPQEQHRRFAEILTVNLNHWGPSPGFASAGNGEAFHLGQYGTLLELEAEFSLTLWPWGERLLKVRGVQGYDEPEKIQWLEGSG